MLDVRADFSEVRAMLTRAEREILPRATSRALNKTVTRVQTRALRLISDDLGFSKVYGRREGVKQVRRYFWVKRATWRNLDASIEAKGKRIPVHKLDARQTGAGVEYSGEDGERKLIPGAFLRTIRVQGTPGAYKRRGKGRFPIQFLRTVSVPHVFVKDRVNRAMLEVAEEAWRKNWPHEVRFALQRAGYSA